ncbi:MAG: methyltransferase domain-containing protein [Halobacteriota archaeon]
MSIKEWAQEQYDYLQDNRHDRFSRPVEWPLIPDWLRPQKNERILDVACGQGQLTVKIALKGRDIYGVDSSATEIGRARRFRTPRNRLHI